MTAQLHILPCLDSDERAAACQQQLDLPHQVTIELGQSALEALKQGHYLGPGGEPVDWSDQIDHAAAAKRSIAPDDDLPNPPARNIPSTQVQVTNETTLQAAQRFQQKGLNPLALNFANGIHPGGGWLRGAKAQEEVLCRSSALYRTLEGDSMYTHHAQRERSDSTAWAILSPDVPIFRTDDGKPLDRPWLCSFITSAAPYAPDVGQPTSGDLLQDRIHRILAIARAHGFTSLVLGAWGCGAFRNDPHRTARDFRAAIEHDFSGHFSDIVFAITDWSQTRRYLGPFRDVMTPAP